MESLALLLLCLVFTTVTVNCQEETVLTVDQQFKRLRENKCLPDDVIGLSAAGCRSDPDLTQELSCIASSASLSGAGGYDSTAGDNYIDSLSADEAWALQQKERLANCSSMMLEQVPADKEGVYMLACWHQLMMSECNRKKMLARTEAVDPENAEELVQAIADLAEGPCFDVGLRYADELGMKWEACAGKNKLDMDVLKGAAHNYFLFSQGREIPEVTVENNMAALEQLDRMNSTRHCYARSSGEVTKDGQVNYTLINELTSNAVGRGEFKVIDTAFVEYCQDQNPANIEEFYDCFNKGKPFACIVLKSYDIALGRVATSGAAMLETSSAAPTAAGIIAGLLGSIF